MEQANYVTINGPKEAVDLLCNFFINHGCELDEDDSPQDDFLYHAPGIPTEITVALIGFCAQLICQLIQTLRQQKNDNSLQKTPFEVIVGPQGNFTISVKDKSPENLRAISQLMSMVNQHPNPQ